MLPKGWHAIGTMAAGNIVCGDVAGCLFDKRRNLKVGDFPDPADARGTSECSA